MIVINRTSPDRWKADVVASVRQYNTWFLEAAPQAYRETRAAVVNDVENLFVATNDMRTITPGIITQNPAIIGTLRMSTAPPLARDRLIGLSYSTSRLMKNLEEGRTPPRMPRAELGAHLERMCSVVETLLDRTLFDWLDTTDKPTPEQRELAAVVVSDRRCGAVADPIVRNAQERRQLAVIGAWLDQRGYRRQAHPSGVPLNQMAPGTYSFRQNVPVQIGDAADGGIKTVSMPIDAVIQPRVPFPNGLPLLVEAKSAGDFTNTNKRRKEEAVKASQLRSTYGSDVQLILFLCGYFDAGYLGYEAAEGLDWVWEHRVDDFEHAGL